MPTAFLRFGLKSAGKCAIIKIIPLARARRAGKERVSKEKKYA